MCSVCFDADDAHGWLICFINPVGVLVSEQCFHCPDCALLLGAEFPHADWFTPSKAPQYFVESVLEEEENGGARSGGGGSSGNSMTDDDEEDEVEVEVDMSEGDEGDDVDENENKPHFG